MEVIKHGRECPTRIECKECGCIYQFERADIQSRPYAENKIVQWVNCPDCGLPHFIDPPKGFVINIRKLEENS